MSKPALALLLPLVACAGATSGDWPTLATRPGEVQPLVQRPAASGGTAQPVPELADADARLSSVERDVSAFAARLAPQLAATAKAATAGRGAAQDSDAGSTAQLEISRLDRLGGQAGDLRDRLNSLAGDLARRGAPGTAFARIGAAIERVEALRAEQAKAYAAASASR